MNNINQTLQHIFGLKNAGHNPQQILQMMINSNPQVSQMLQTVKNMANGKDPKQFFSQLAIQNGVDQNNLNMIMQMFN
jgi:hypothetical protein